MGVEIDMAQRAWYVATLESECSGDIDLMYQEYPSTPDEPFLASTEGSYYKVQMTRVRKEKRITQVPYTPGVPVNTFWDIANSDARWQPAPVHRVHRGMGRALQLLCRRATENRLRVGYAPSPARRQPRSPGAGYQPVAG